MTREWARTRTWWLRLAIGIQMAGSAIKHIAYLVADKTVARTEMRGMEPWDRGAELIGLGVCVLVLWWLLLREPEDGE